MFEWVGGGGGGVKKISKYYVYCRSISGSAIFLLKARFQHLPNIRLTKKR